MLLIVKKLQEIFELSHDGWNFVAEEVTRHETGPKVVMNCSAYNNGKSTWLAAGQESHCQLYDVTSRVVTLENGEILKGTSASTISKENLRQRRKSEKNIDTSNSPVEKLEDDKKNNNKYKRLQLILKPLINIQTDFNDLDPRQRIVKISPNGKLMATGGTDGTIRLWKFPQLKKLWDFEEHTKEINDIDFNLSSTFIATIAKDGRAIVWDVIKGIKSKELSGNNGAKYQRLRFRIPNEKKANEQLFMLSNATSPKSPSYLQLWDIEQGIVIKSTSFKETLSALAVSDDGKFVAVGTMFSGSVDIFVAFSLQRVLHVSEAHSMFITGLEFLQTKLDDSNLSDAAITSNAEAAVVSISIDNKICIHSIPFRREFLL